MVNPLLDALANTRGLRQALPFLTKIVQATPELSNAAIMASARAAGLHFENVGVGVVLNQLKANVNIAQQFRVASLDQIPSLDTLGQALTPLKKNYSFIARIAGFNPLTGLRETTHVTVVSDTLMTPADIQAAALRFGDTGQSGAGLINRSVSVESGLVSPLAI